MAGCLYITVGISGSGKSRFAEFFCEATDAIELNADNYRKELGKGVNDQDINKVVFTEIDKAIVKYFAGGYSVFISNTNLHAGKIKELAEKFPLNEIVVFFLKDSEDIELCWNRIQKDLENGKDRSNVPREVLENLLKKREANFLKAHYIIDTSIMNEEEIVEAILGSVNEAESDCRS